MFSVKSEEAVKMLVEKFEGDSIAIESRFLANQQGSSSEDGKRLIPDCVR